MKLKERQKKASILRVHFLGSHIWISDTIYSANTTILTSDAKGTTHFALFNKVDRNWEQGNLHTFLSTASDGNIVTFFWIASLRINIHQMDIAWTVLSQTNDLMQESPLQIKKKILLPFVEEISFKDFNKIDRKLSFLKCYI